MLEIVEGVEKFRWKNHPFDVYGVLRQFDEHARIDAIVTRWRARGAGRVAELIPDRAQASARRRRSLVEKHETKAEILMRRKASSR